MEPRRVKPVFVTTHAFERARERFGLANISREQIQRPSAASRSTSARCSSTSSTGAKGFGWARITPEGLRALAEAVERYGLPEFPRTGS